MGRKLVIPFLFFCFFSVLIFAGQPLTSVYDRINSLQERADSGDAVSLYQLAKLYDMGFDTIKPDSIKSTALYRKSAEKGYAPARNFLGFRYYKGEFVEKNVDSALYWIRLAAKDNDITAAANLAYLLSESDEVTKDSVEAFKWLKIAAEGGVLEAQELYKGKMHEEWEMLDVDTLMPLGLKYFMGTAPVLGVDLFKIAAGRGVIKALALLGDAYSKGIGVPYDHNLSLDFFHQAAVEGDASAQFILAELLEFFPDVYNDHDATYWYSKAAESGITNSEEANEKLFVYP